MSPFLEGLGAKMGQLGAKMGQLGAEKAKDPPRGPQRQMLVGFYTNVGQFLDNFLLYFLIFWDQFWIIFGCATYINMVQQLSSSMFQLGSNMISLSSSGAPPDVT